MTKDQAERLIKVIESAAAELYGIKTKLDTIELRLEDIERNVRTLP